MDAWVALALAAILVLGFSLRITNLNWDEGHHLHPDERHISNVSGALEWPESASGYFDSKTSPLNPYNHVPSFVYGTFPVFLNKAVSGWLAKDSGGPRAVRGALDSVGINVQDDSGTPLFDDGYNSNLTGRVLAAFFDTATLLLVYLLGQKLWGRSAGLLAAFLMALTVLHIQHSHFFVTDVFLVFFTTALLLSCVHIARDGPRWSYLLGGASLGFALASKVSVAPLALVFVAAVLIRMRKQREVRTPILWLLLSFLLAAVVFRVLNPYAFSGPGLFDFSLSERFLDDFREQWQLQTGGDWPPNYQWIGRLPVLFPLKNLALWGLGLPLTIAAVIGGLRPLRGIRKDPLGPEALLLLWIVIVVVFVSRNFIMTMRYLLPIYPALVLFAAYGLIGLWRNPAFKPRWPALSHSAIRRLGRGAAALLVLGAAFWAFAFVAGVYGDQNPRVRASEWMAERVPSGSTILVEEWDDPLPLSVRGVEPDEYELIFFPAYGVDTSEKIFTLLDSLDESDYIVQSSNRAYDSLPRVPARFPSTLRYYDALFSERLGFKKVGEFTSHPSLLGLDINDESAEEAFSVYDHPKVLLWQKTSSYSRFAATAALQPDRADAAISLPPDTAAKNASQLSPDDAVTQEKGGTWSEVFSGGWFNDHLPWLWWLLWLEVAGLAVLPWTTRIFRHMPDRGFGYTKVIGLIAVALPIWLLVSWKVIDFSSTATRLAFIAVAGLGLFMGFRDRERLAEAFKEKWKLWTAEELVFLLVFLAFLIIRAANPDLWHSTRGGEKPMEMAFLTAITRSTTFPPLDPWFSGGALNYYYLGWFFLSTPIRAFGFLPQIAFNLAIPTFAAVAACTTFSNAANLAGLTGGTKKRGLTIVWAGLAGAALLVLIGNLDAVRQVFQRVFGDADAGAFDWWAPSRVHPDSSDITEFPLWSFIFGDVHPHVMGLPFAGLVLGFAIALVASARRSTPSHRHVLAVCLGIASGLVRAIHTWDLPVVLGISCGAVVLATLAHDAASWLSRVKQGAIDLLLVGVTHLAVIAPFISHQELFNSGFQRSPRTTSPSEYFIHLGVFVVIAGGVLVFRNSQILGRLNGSGGGRFSKTLNAALIAVAIGGAAVASLWGIEVLVVGLMLVALLTPMLIYELKQENPNLGYLLATGVLIAAIAASVFADALVVENDIDRMNTVFKFLFQSWHLFAVFGGFGVWFLIESLRTTEPRPGRFRVAAKTQRVTWGILLATSLLAGSVYAFAGTPARLRDRFEITAPTLDGLAYLGTEPTVTDADGEEISLADDLPLIEWLRANAVGTPTILEAPGPLYTWTSRISVNTGLPTVIGWDWHETQQRWAYSDEIADRVEEVEAFYESDDDAEAARLLLRYDVEYVVVGTLERARGEPEGIANLESIQGLTPVFRSGENVIYRVDPALLTRRLYG